MKNKACSVLITIAVVSASVLWGSRADSQSAFTPPVLNAFGDEPTGNDGFFFTPTTALSVTALGYVYPGAASGNLVGLYDVSTSTLLASATITSASPSSGSFLFEAIHPITLVAGNEYAIVGLYTAGAGAVGYYADNGMGAAAQINFDAYLYDYNPSLDLPTVGFAPAIVGPNFQFSVQSVPEPGSVALMATGLLAVYVLGRRKAGGTWVEKPRARRPVI